MERGGKQFPNKMLAKTAFKIIFKNNKEWCHEVLFNAKVVIPVYHHMISSNNTGKARNKVYYLLNIFQKTLTS